LVEIAAELAVEVDIDRDGVILIAANQHSVFSEKKVPASICRLPVNVEEVGGIEDIILIEDLFIQPLSDAKTNTISYLSGDVEVEVVGKELAAIHSVDGFLVENAPGIYIELIYLCLRRKADPAKKQGRRQNSP
jgi:hypothetical protein